MSSDTHTCTNRSSISIYAYKYTITMKYRTRSYQYPLTRTYFEILWDEPRFHSIHRALPSPWPDPCDLSSLSLCRRLDPRVELTFTRLRSTARRRTSTSRRVSVRSAGIRGPVGRDGFEAAIPVRPRRSASHSYLRIQSRRLCWDVFAGSVRVGLRLRVAVRRLRRSVLVETDWA